MMPFGRWLVIDTAPGRGTISGTQQDAHCIIQPGGQITGTGPAARAMTAAFLEKPSISEAADGKAAGPCQDTLLSIPPAHGRGTM